MIEESVEGVTFQSYSALEEVKKKGLMKFI